MIFKRTAAMLHRRTVALSVLLSAAIVIATTLLLVVVAWQGAYSFLSAAATQRLESGEQAFNYFNDRRAGQLDSLVLTLANGSAIPPARLAEVLALGSADYVAFRSATGDLQVAPPELAQLVDDTTTLQHRAKLPLPQGGEAIAGYLYSAAFSDQFRAWTGLDITIYAGKTVSGSSLPASVGPGSPGVSPARFTVGGVSYLGRSYTLYDRAAQPLGTYLISLPESFTAIDHLKVLQDFLPFLCALLLFSGTSTFVIARQVTAPLRNLRGALSRIGEGDLDTPIQAESRAGTMPLAPELEDLRQKLHAALNQLAIEKSMYQGIFQSMGNGVYTTDPAGRITSFNPAARDLLGSMEPGGPCCDSWLVTEGQDRRLCDQHCVWLWMNGEAEPTVVKTQLRPEGPDPRDLEITVAPIKDEAERTVGLVHIVRDITPEQELVRLKERFLMSVAHELRTPLSSLSASVELLQEDFASLAPDSRNRMLATVRRGALRLGNLITDLLDLGSIQAGRFTVYTQPVPLMDPVQEAVALTESLLEAKGQQIQVQLLDPSLTVAGDSPRLCQVLVNLISNAGKYGPEGDTIEVTVERSAGASPTGVGAARIAVKDHGNGIGPEERARVFEYYFRGADASRSQNGFGLGLAIIKGIVDAHGGDIDVDSEPGQGTTFWFTVPLAEEPLGVH